MSVLDFGDGKSATVTADKGAIWLQLCANRGSLGVQIDRRSAIQLRAALLAAILKIESETK